MTIAVYAGSFDPITFGHLDIIQRAQQVFDEGDTAHRLVIAIGVNSAKKPLFSAKERIELIEEARKGPGWAPHIVTFSGLLVDFCRHIGATVIIRGLRAVVDFEYELGIAHANTSQAPHIQTMFLPTQPEYSFVSSSVVRELARYGGNLDAYVPHNVKAALQEKLGTHWRSR